MATATTAAKKTAAKTPAKAPAKKTTARKAPAKKPTTPAEIPAETAAAQQSNYDPAMALTLIHSHPRNPRHKAAADVELIESLKDQGLIHDLVVAPHPSITGEYILIDGHRRLDGLTKAGFTFAPAKIRLDLLDEAAQLAAMLATIRREDFTPIEEAEGFESLIGMGWSVERISSATGRSKSTIQARRTLVTKLKPSLQAKISVGQATIEDALALAALPVKEQTRLEQYVDRGGFRFELNRSKDRVTRENQVNKEIAAWKKAGVPQVTKPKNFPGVHYLTDATHGMTWLPKFPGTLATADGHTKGPTGCLGWINTGTAQYPGIDLVCLSYAAHDAELEEHRKARAAELSDEAKARAAEQAEREAKTTAEQEAKAAAAESRRVAALMRANAAVAAVKVDARTIVPPVLLPSLKAFLITHLTSMSVNSTVFNELAKVPEDLAHSAGYSSISTNYLNTISAMAPADVCRVFVATVLAHTEDLVSDVWVYGEANTPEDGVTINEYLALLQQAGHELTPPDQELLKALNPDDEPADPYEALHLSAGSGLVVCGLPGTSGKNLTATRELDNVSCAECIEAAPA